MKDIKKRLCDIENNIKQNEEKTSRVTFKDGTVKDIPLLELYKVAVRGEIAEVHYPAADKELYVIPQAIGRAENEKVIYKEF